MTIFAEILQLTACDSTAITAAIKNIYYLIEYCKEQSQKYNDPVCKYCYRKLTDRQVWVALIIFNDVIGQLGELNNL